MSSPCTLQESNRMSAEAPTPKGSPGIPRTQVFRMPLRICPSFGGSSGTCAPDRDCTTAESTLSLAVHRQLQLLTEPTLPVSYNGQLQLQSRFAYFPHGIRIRAKVHALCPPDSGATTRAELLGPFLSTHG